MNRIQLWPTDLWETPAAPAVASPAYSSEAAYAELFTPHDYEPNYEYPLLVWLHGPGGDRREMLQVMPHLSLRNYVAVGPQGFDHDDEGAGCYWPTQTDSAEDIEHATARILEAVAWARHRRKIHPQRIFIAGLQEGGVMALRVALQAPEHFAGAISLGGPFPLGEANLSQWSQVRQLPLFLAQGREDHNYPAEQVRDELQLFHAASMKVHVRRYPGGDELTTQMLLDMNAWMMEQINQPQAAKCG